MEEEKKLFCDYLLGNNCFRCPHLTMKREGKYIFIACARKIQILKIFIDEEEN